MGVFPPGKILELRAPAHYNTPGSRRERQVAELVVAREKRPAIIKLRDLREVAEEYEIEVVEEIG